MQLLKENILLNQSFKTKEEAIRMAGQLLVQSGFVDESYVDAMLEREKIVTTYMGNFVAIPHGTEAAKKLVKETGISVIQVPFGVNFAGEGEEEKLATMIFAIAGKDNDHLDLLSQIAVLCSDPHEVVKLVNAQTKERLIEMIEGVKA